MRSCSIRHFNSEILVVLDTKREILVPLETNSETWVLDILTVRSG